jgi:peptidyl-prolyl cis-trans isomerase SurA
MKKLIFLPAFLLSATVVLAQQKVVADQIAGIVGDKIILKSELQNTLADAIRNSGGADMKGLDECNVLDNLLIQKALVVQAEHDSLPVSDEEVEAEVDQRIRHYEELYGGKEAFEQIAQRTVYQAKQDFMAPIREQRLAQAMRQHVVEDVKITPTEVKEYFDKIPADKRIFYESEIQLSQIVLYPKPSRDIEKLAQDELNEYKQEVESGQKKFEFLAQLYSDDPGTKDKGGEMELNRNDSRIWDPVFFSTAFRLKEGQISNVIKSKYGYHIIQLVSRNGDDIVIREILRIPQITQPEVDLATAQLDSIRTQLMAGAIPFGVAVGKYSDDEQAKATAGQLMNHNGSTFLTISDLDKDMVLLLKNSDLKPGQYSKPTIFVDERGKKGVRVVYMVSKSEPHRENLRDDYNNIASRALDEKRSAALEKWFLQKIPTMYVMIADDYRNCSTLTKWEGQAATAGK